MGASYFPTQILLELDNSFYIARSLSHGFLITQVHSKPRCKESTFGLCVYINRCALKALQVRVLSVCFVPVKYLIHQLQSQHHYELGFNCYWSDSQLVGHHLHLNPQILSYNQIFLPFPKAPHWQSILYFLQHFPLFYYSYHELVKQDYSILPSPMPMFFI